MEKKLIDELFPPPPVLPPRTSLVLKLEECFRTRRGPQVCALVGPSGIGKTYLADRLQAMTRSWSFQMVWANGIQQAGGAPPFTAVGRLTSADGKSGREMPIELSYREGLVGTLRAWSESRPVVLCCDNVQSFDAASLDWLASMVWRLDHLSVSLLLLLPDRAGASQLERLWKELEVHAGAVQSFLVPRLTIEEMVTISEKRLGGQIKFTAARIRWLQKLSQGNPLILIQCLEYLRESGWMYQTPRKTWKLTPETPSDLPTFQEIVSRRLDAAVARELSFARDWVERGATLRATFSVPVSVAPALARIGERTGYLKEVVPGGTSFRFQHELIRSAIEEAATERRPEILREVLGLREEARAEEESDLVLADLYQRAGAVELAIEEVGMAAMNASVYGFPSEAARLASWEDGLLESLGQPREGASRLEAAELRAEALYSARRYRDVVDTLLPLEIPAYRQRRPQLLFLLGAARSRLAGTITLAQALESLQRAFEVAKESKDIRLGALLHLELARALRGRDEGRARRNFFRAVQLSSREKDSHPYLHSSVLRQARLFLEPEVARRHTERAVELCEGESMYLTLAFALNNLGVILLELGRLTEAERNLWESSKMLEKRGGWGMAVPINNLALLALYRRDEESAAAYFERAAIVAEDYERFLAIRCNWARLTAQDNPAKAAKDLRGLLDSKTSLGQDLQSAIKFNLGRALLEAGFPEEALQAAKASPPWLGQDRDLATGAWAKLRLRAYGQLGITRVVEANLLRRAKVLDETPKSHSWIYSDLWAPGEMLFT